MHDGNSNFPETPMREKRCFSNILLFFFCLQATIADQMSVPVWLSTHNLVLYRPLKFFIVPRDLEHIQEFICPIFLRQDRKDYISWLCLSILNYALGFLCHHLISTINLTLPSNARRSVVSDHSHSSSEWSKTEVSLRWILSRQRSNSSSRVSFITIKFGPSLKRVGISKWVTPRRASGFFLPFV